MVEAVAIGLVAGVVAGLLGVGGGALFVPALTIGLGLSQQLGGLAVSGAVAGAVLANAVPERALEIGFAVLILFVAAQLVRRALTADG